MSGFGVVRRIQPREEGVIRTAVEPFEREQHAHAHIELTRLVFGVGRAADVAAAALQLGAQLLLRQAVSTAQSAQIFSDVAVAPQFLLHHISPDPVAFDQYWLQLNRVYAKL